MQWTVDKIAWAGLSSRHQLALAPWRRDRGRRAGPPPRPRPRPSLALALALALALVPYRRVRQGSYPPQGADRLVPENTPTGRTTEMPGQALRQWGREHPTLVAVKTLLPNYPAEREVGLPPGLYVDHLRTPWVAVRGEIRVSLARIICVTDEGRHQLIGQVQVTANELDVAGSITLRFYLHQPAGVIAREIADEGEWWLGVLDAHYAAGGSPIESAPAGIAA